MRREEIRKIETTTDVQALKKEFSNLISLNTNTGIENMFFTHLKIHALKKRISELENELHRD